MKKFIVYYHDTAPEINRCWGNSQRFEIRARNVIEALSKYWAKYTHPVYDVSINHLVALGYDATQALIRFEKAVCNI